MDDEFVLDEVFSKSFFLEVNEKEFNNVNGVNNHKTNKHMEVQVKNAFDEWWTYQGYDTKNLLSIYLIMKRLP